MQDEPRNLHELVNLHLTRYPCMELRDIYKLLYQGVLGAEHMVGSELEFHRCLLSEFERVLPDPLQPLLEPVRTDRKLFRMNLRRYKAQQTDLDQLYPSLFETAQHSIGSKSELHVAWEEFIQLCTQGLIRNFDPDAIQRFNRWLEEKSYPLLHHSIIYRREYQPAYRLISAEFISGLGQIDESRVR